MARLNSRISLGVVAIAAALGFTPLAATAGGYKHDLWHHWPIHGHHGGKDQSFNRIASFPAFKNTDVANTTSAEIIAASEDGKTLIYTDSPMNGVGFVDITNPADPQPAGFIDLKTALGQTTAEPTSVAVKGPYALVAVNTSADYINTGGVLAVIKIATHQIMRTIDLGGQPDSIAISKDGKYATIAIENERDEDLGSGAPPQSPAGYVVIVDLKGYHPSSWMRRDVTVANEFAGLYPSDPEPEYVDINEKNIAVVTLQENNHLVLIDLKTGTIVNEFSAGSVDLDEIDTKEEDPALISLTGSKDDLLREPDGVTWISSSLFATADEGDLDGGSRGFTIFDKTGAVKFSSGNTLEHLAVRFGHYPDYRSKNKGNEPENVKFAEYGRTGYLFVGSERASIVFVYEIGRNGMPVYKQTLPTGSGPEGLLAIPKRGLFVVASEVDDRNADDIDEPVRSVVSIYRLEQGDPKYPTIESADRPDHTPIPWAALSGLAVDDKGNAYTLHDSYYQQSRIYKMKLGKTSPATITDEIVLRDDEGLLAQAAPNRIADGVVSIDGEGVGLASDSGFWVVSEGDGNNPNLLLKIAGDGAIKLVAKLPADTIARKINQGFEGVTEADDGFVYVAFQRQWKDDLEGYVRIGRFDPAVGSSDPENAWKFFYYKLDAPASPNGGWVGLSAIDYLGNGKFIVIERDNQAGADARIKKLYTFSVAGLNPLADVARPAAPAFPVVVKSELRDLLPDFAATGGQTLEKVEGVAVDRWGTIYVVNDNDGIVEGSNGETQLMRLRLRHPFTTAQRW